MNIHDEQLWEEINTRPDDPRHCVWMAGTKTLCGKDQPNPALSPYHWGTRHQATCEKCQLLVAIADANGIGPDAEPSIRGALDRFLREHNCTPST